VRPAAPEVFPDTDASRWSSRPPPPVIPPPPRVPRDMVDLAGAHGLGRPRALGLVWDTARWGEFELSETDDGSVPLITVADGLATEDEVIGAVDPRDLRIQELLENGTVHVDAASAARRREENARFEAAVWRERALAFRASLKRTSPAWLGVAHTPPQKTGSL
jgi:hypothetical protein